MFAKTKFTFDFGCRKQFDIETYLSYSFFQSTANFKRLNGLKFCKKYGFLIYI